MRCSVRVVVAGLGVVVAVGCGAPETPAASSSRVALVVASTVPERWHRAVGAGLERIASELEAEVSHRVAASESDRLSLIRQSVVAEGADVVFCVGEGFAPLVFSEAAVRPDTRYVVLPGRGHGTTVIGLGFRIEGAAYLAGVLAAMISENGAVGVVLGGAGPWLGGAEEGFLAGFASVHGGAEAVYAQGSGAAWSLAAQGVSIALYVADQAERDVLSAAHDAGLQLILTDPGVLDSDPEVALAAIVVDVPEAMVRVAREALAGTIQSPDRGFDLASGVVNLRLGPLLTRAPDPTLHEALEAARAEVAAGIVELESLGM